MIFIKEEAKLDVLAAAQYARVGNSLQINFLMLWTGRLKILQSPEANPIIVKNYRRSLIPKFPYSIYYRTDDNEVTIVAVLHNSSGLRNILNKIREI